ncbi:E3 SUMO-protein ligase RanBP2 [Ceratobasidium sp. 414]|nr:E3 SUMO-protein ligase RanBP2 [Ceratobasidium sp. 414]
MYGGAEGVLTKQSESSTSERKERGTGEVRLPQHKAAKKVRALMCRDKRLKNCANRYITSDMKLQPDAESDHTCWIWKDAADVSDGEPDTETFTSSFANEKIADEYKTAFEDEQPTTTALAEIETAPPLTEHVVKMYREDEDVLIKYNRAKLFKFKNSTSDWEGCGTGEVRLMQHKETKKVRVLVRRNKTLKICANHYITSDMKLRPNVGSDRSWIWKAAADTSDGKPATKTFGIRFANKETHFEPVSKLTEQVVTKMQEDEDILTKHRAKLFKFERSISEWKERGIGEVRLLQHKETKKVRVLMCLDKTLKVCANHYITSDMELKPNVGSDRSWVWSVAADVSDDEPVAKTFAIRFASKKIAGEYKIAFENAQAAATVPAEAETVPPVVAKMHEGDEDVLTKHGAGLFRLESSTSEWKECGTGEVRLLQHKVTKKARVVMLRDGTLEICANHNSTYITSDMKLQPNVGSDRSWIWRIATDVSDGEPVTETLAICFANKDVAGEYKVAFENAQAAATSPVETAPPAGANATETAPPVVTKAREGEDVLTKHRAKLFKLESSTSEWKERGTGEVRLLQHKETKRVRVVMRRDKTLKVCANHYITSNMKLLPNIGSDRSWVWRVPADISDGEPVAETFAIRFANKEIADRYKVAFENAEAATQAETAPPAGANATETVFPVGANATEIALPMGANATETTSPVGANTAEAAPPVGANATEAAFPVGANATETAPPAGANATEAEVAKDGTPATTEPGEKE